MERLLFYILLFGEDKNIFLKILQCQSQTFQMILPISVKKTLSLGRLEKYEIFYLHEQIYDAISKWAPCFPSHHFK
jgi:hypothetical protein